jgi:hypothetical protein
MSPKSPGKTKASTPKLNVPFSGYGKHVQYKGGKQSFAEYNENLKRTKKANVIKRAKMDAQFRASTKTNKKIK